METAERLITADEYLARDRGYAWLPLDTKIDVLTSTQLPGFELNLGALFEPAF
jgi:hypothetical protein